MNDERGMLDDAAARLREFVVQRRKMSGLDPSVVASVCHHQQDGPADLRLDDLERLLVFHASTPDRWAAAFAQPVSFHLAHPGEDAPDGCWRVEMWWGDMWSDDGEDIRMPDATGAGRYLGTALRRTLADWNDNN